MKYFDYLLAFIFMIISVLIIIVFLFYVKELSEIESIKKENTIFIKTLF
jgi:uncharacterized membrane protein